jgi:hypothetical protein
MRLLLDSNVFLEILLRQEEADEAMALLSTVESNEFFISDFALHSVGFILFYRKRHDDFRRFVRDMILGASVTEVRLPAEKAEPVADIAMQFNLDFDDAYQYAIAQEYDLTLVSFDGDFDRTERGRRTPAQVLQG